VTRDPQVSGWRSKELQDRDKSQGRTVESLVPADLFGDQADQNAQRLIQSIQQPLQQ
jgi:hypothetical protein